MSVNFAEKFINFKKNIGKSHHIMSVKYICYPKNNIIATRIKFFLVLFMIALLSLEYHDP